MDVIEFPLLPVHNLNNEDIIKQMQLEIGASGAAQSENTLDQIIEQVITVGIRLSMSKNQRCLLTPLAQLQLSPPLAQRLLTLPLALLLPCQTQDLLLGHQLWLIPPVQIILVQIAPSLNLASRRKE